MNGELNDRVSSRDMAYFFTAGAQARVKYMLLYLPGDRPVVLSRDGRIFWGAELRPWFFMGVFESGSFVLENARRLPRVG